MFGMSAWTCASDSCWEESPGSGSWNNGVTGEWRGCKNDRFGRAIRHRTGDAQAAAPVQRKWMDKLDIWKADGVGYHSGGVLLDV